jgi:23S rRNA (uracil1939-C5)-methyltransferase
MRTCRIRPYDEKTGKGLVRHVLIRYGFSTGELMVTLVINGRKLPRQEELIRQLSTVPGMKSISININDKNTNVILGTETICIWGDPCITDYIYLRDCRDDRFERTDQAVAFQISPQSFYQVNPMQTEKLYSLALEYAGLTGKEHVWDLYCGIGTISLFLAGHAAQVYGVEVVPEAIEDARRNAALNKIENAQFFVGKAEEILPQFYRQQGEDAAMSHPDVIVVDPPRKGCDQVCLDTMLAMQPERIVYVSCDPATLSRDLRILCDGGYELRRVRPLDQFLHTVHCESIALLQPLRDRV